ncbi:hypothetical protein HAX54_025742 [Datura stramonium]|uniref:Uncharacterized protein n=1 Tax=Datura stramonium TaxID=4076 RepID=A0ABS8V007_DATST|nr:hypothetical protein [Datura stramonium]
MTKELQHDAPREEPIVLALQGTQRGSKEGTLPGARHRPPSSTEGVRRLSLRCFTLHGAPRGTMTSKRKEVNVAKKIRKRGRPRKTDASFSAPKSGSTRRFGATAVEPKGLTLFNTKKEAKYAPKNWIDKGFLALEFPTIRKKIRKLGVGYMFNESERCNLTLVREFYANRDTSFENSTKV